MQKYPVQKRIFPPSDSLRYPYANTQPMSDSTIRKPQITNRSKGLTSRNVRECPKLSDFEKSFFDSSYPLSSILYPPSSIFYPLSPPSCPLPTAYCPLPLSG